MKKANRSTWILSSLLCLAVLLLAGCVHSGQTPAPLPPGALNTFDADSYRVLSDAHAAIQSIHDDVVAGKVHLGAGQKLVLNQIIDDSNLADHMYKAYHAQLGGQSTDQLTRAIQQLVADLASLSKLFPTPATATNGAAK